MVRRRVVQLLVIVSVVVAAVLVAAPEAEAVDLCADLHNVPYRYATSLDDHGDVGGFGDRTRAYTWNWETDQTRWLGGIQNGLASGVNDISPNGTWLAGFGDVPSTLTPSGQRHNGWRRGPTDTRLVPVPTPYGYETELVAITDTGLAAGNIVNLANSVRRPFVWLSTGEVVNLLWPQPFLTGSVMDLHPDGSLLVHGVSSAVYTLLYRAPYNSYPMGGLPGPPARFGALSDIIAGRGSSGGVVVVHLNSTTPSFHIPSRIGLGDLGDYDPIEGVLVGGGGNGAWVFRPGDPEVTFVTTQATGGGYRIARRINRHGDLLIEHAVSSGQSFVVWDKQDC